MYKRRMERSASLFCFLFLAASLTAGCGASGTRNTGSSVEVLDPTQPHYGNSDDEWGALWWKWIYELPQTAAADGGAPNCIIPFLDPTGADCAVGQSGDVFYLAGTGGGVVVRDKCVVPAGKAIFFPILSFSADNAGVPAAMQLPETGLMGYVQKQLDGIPSAGLSAEIDGVPIANLARFKTKVTKFSYTLPPEPNVYTCEGATGVTGLVDPSYAAGYYIMLAPLVQGAHTLHFAGSSPATNPPIMVDVTYHLTIE
jgi:hypothetical protein